MTGAFAGFPEEAFAFFEAIAADTSWEAVSTRRELHERAVRGPMVALTSELEREFGPAKVYRLHRPPDLWTTQYAYVSLADTIVLGASLSLEGLAVEGGWLYSSADQVERFRQAVAGPTGAELEGIVEALRAGGFETIGVTLRSAPRGYPADHPRIDLLRRRSLIATRELGRGEWLNTREAVAHVWPEWRRLRPLTDWLLAHVGARDGR